MGIDCAKTPRGLFEAIRTLLTGKGGTADTASLAVAYQGARTKIVTFRDTWSALPKLPAHNTDPLAGLQECMEWCTEAKEVMQGMLARMDGHIIQELISVLEQVRVLPRTAWPEGDGALFDKAVKRARRVAEKWGSRDHEPRRIPFEGNTGAGRTGRLAAAAAVMSGLTAAVYPRVRKKGVRKLLDRAKGKVETTSRDERETNEGLTPYEEMQILVGADRICRLMDDSYQTGLLVLASAIDDRLERFYNELMRRTPTGEMLAAYDELTGGPLTRALEELIRAREIDALVEDQWLLLFKALQYKAQILGRRPMDSLIDEVVTTLREIQRLRETLAVGPKPEKEPNQQEQANEMPSREETGSGAETINIQESTVFMNSNVIIKVHQHIEYITNLQDTIAALPEDNPAFGKVAKKTALDIIGSALKDVAKGQVKEAAKQIYELGKDLGSVIVDTAAYGFFKSCLGL